MDSIPVQLPLCSLDTKVCSICHTLLPIDQFNIRKRATGKRQQRCRACFSAYNAARYAAKGDEIRAAVRAYRVNNNERVTAGQRAKRPAYEQRHAADMKRYRREHAADACARAAAWREAHPEWKKANDANWRKANPGRKKANDRRRKQRIALSGDAYTGQEWEAIKANYDYRCLWCKRQEPAIKLTADHVVPVSKGGTNDIGNIQPLCFSCNSRKNARYMDFR